MKAKMGYLASAEASQEEVKQIQIVTKEKLACIAGKVACTAGKLFTLQNKDLDTVCNFCLKNHPSHMCEQ